MHVRRAAHRLGELAGQRARPYLQLTANLLTGDAAVQEADRLYAQRLAMLATPDRFPGIAANLGGGRLEDFDADYTADEFQVGLNVVLDGIQRLIDRRNH
ncbi:hypothetical protein [Kribbella sp. ALI-6-A]|uniref:hypothetical protein n=1 Tax=Kribbella sp. ALI-6-A TaxID=1933817 RepID=UPI00117A25B2|nr:hypothetical protein [Kribbella sp. ALI-6-A]